MLHYLLIDSSNRIRLSQGFTLLLEIFIDCVVFRSTLIRAMLLLRGWVVLGTSRLCNSNREEKNWFHNRFEAQTISYERSFKLTFRSFYILEDGARCWMPIRWEGRRGSILFYHLRWRSRLTSSNFTSFTAQFDFWCCAPQPSLLQINSTICFC